MQHTVTELTVGRQPSKEPAIQTEKWTDINPLKGRDVNWLHFAIQV